MENDNKYLVQKLKDGDESVWIDLFREYYVSLCAYSRRYVGRKDIAEEMVSEMFFRMWNNRNTLTIHGSIKSYLFQAVNQHFLISALFAAVFSAPEITGINRFLRQLRNRPVKASSIG